MHSPNNNLENQFRNLMEDFDGIPSEGVWDKIDAQLDNKKPWWHVFKYIFPFMLVAGLLTIIFLNKPLFNGKEISSLESTEYQYNNEHNENKQNELVVVNDSKSSTRGIVANSAIIASKKEASLKPAFSSKSAKKSANSPITQSGNNLLFNKSNALSNTLTLAEAKNRQLVKNTRSANPILNENNSGNIESFGSKLTTLSGNGLLKDHVEPSDQLSLVQDNIEGLDKERGLYSSDKLMEPSIALLSWETIIECPDLNEKEEKERSFRMTWGYNKNFPLDFKNNHNIWSNVRKVTKKGFWYGVRGDFQVWNYNQNDPTQFSSTFDITTNSEFILENYDIDHDRLDVGFRTLPTYTASSVNYAFHTMVGYELKVKKWRFDLGAGPGITYSYYRTLPAGINIQLIDDRFQGEEGVLLLGAYY